MNTKRNRVRGTISGGDYRSISVKYGSGPCDLAIVRICDCHGLPSLDEGAEVELRYISHGARGAWYHAFPATAGDAPPDNDGSIATLLREQAALSVSGSACMCDGSGIYIEDNGVRGSRQRKCPAKHS